MIDNTLESEQIKLRALEPTDLEVLYQWENNVEIWKVSNTITPFSKYVLRRYLESSHLDIWETKQQRLIIEKRGKSLKPVPIGMVDLFDFEPFHQRAGVGMLIAQPKDRQKGFAAEALRLLIGYSFGTLMLHQLYANITTNNTASLKLFRNSGFIDAGVKKEWIKTLNGWQDEATLQLLNPYNR